MRDSDRMTVSRPPFRTQGNAEHRHVTTSARSHGGSTDTQNKEDAVKRRTFLGAAAATLALGAGGGAAFLGQEKFGALPEGEALLRIKASPNYKGGQFRNLVPRPVLSDGSTLAGTFFRFITKKREASVTPRAVPSARPDFHTLPREKDILIWLGHSSFFLQLGGKRLLIDPVLDDHASPVSFNVRAFPGSTPCSVSDLPPVDCLLISHDHWDHLDYATVTALRDRIGLVLCGLGTGAHFLRWGFEKTRLREADWGETLCLGDRLRIHVTTASHYSGRGLTRNQALWTGFLMETPECRVFFSGDGGYGAHFADLGRRFGRVDIALLDSGQYNESWKYIHMTPEEAVQAAADLGARYVLPAHTGRFALAYHPWDEPFRRAEKAAAQSSVQLLTPLIGDTVTLTGDLPVFPRWWEDAGA